MSSKKALVIGASGGIGNALVEILAKSDDYAEVHGVSRSQITSTGKVIGHQLDSQNSSAVEQFCQQLKDHGPLDLVVCCIGALHGKQNEIELSPEKRLEDISPEMLLSYFNTNTVAPANWLKYLLPVIKGNSPAHVVLITARVGSIEDNKIGGWYGYRASKAALNMLIKTAQVEYRRRAKNVDLVSYHPGTVDTGLSKPFQSNVPDGKLFSAEFTATQLLKHLPQLNPDQAPHYIDWQGKVIPW